MAFARSSRNPHYHNAGLNPCRHTTVRLSRVYAGATDTSVNPVGLNEGRLTGEARRV